MTQEHEIICTLCPLACHIKLVSEGEKIITISDYGCKKGKEYAIQEFKFPQRVLTTTIRTSDITHPLLSVRTNKPISKKLLKECMILLANEEISPPVKIGEVVISNVLNTGSDVIATQELI
ncbi:DUF1667 domain-containing protein [Candidatus Aerophobetes bacterium]|nr:DUF1667 domain-containing protein [Candidatus Aerophobetes bacterium]